ncbi:MAG: tRNA (N6-threonylcarbamoyladenosine(37)-N6)-methyltransferase TrmO [Candidatus Odinarchaeota archaeon]
MKECIIRPIGIVKNKVDAEILKYNNKDIELDRKRIKSSRHAFDISEILIYDEYLECLDGIEDFSHLMIIYWTHKTPDSARSIKKVHPAGLKSMPIKGIFATRSPVRPNPLALISVRLLECKDNILIVEGLDAINESPVLDIKPHLPSYDSPLNVKIADWMYAIGEQFKELHENGENNEELSESPHFDMRSHPCISDEQKL